MLNCILGYPLFDLDKILYPDDNYCGVVFTSFEWINFPLSLKNTLKYHIKEVFFILCFYVPQYLLHSSLNPVYLYFILEYEGKLYAVSSVTRVVNYYDATSWFRFWRSIKKDVAYNAQRILDLYDGNLYWLSRAKFHIVILTESDQEHELLSNVLTLTRKKKL